MNEATNNPWESADAKLWAHEFIRLFGNKKDEIDESLMLAWFACAIERGKMEEAKRVRDKLNTFDQTREALKDACLTYAVHGEQPPQNWLDALAAME